VDKRSVKNRVEDAKKSLVHNPVPDARLMDAPPLRVGDKK